MIAISDYLTFFNVKKLSLFVVILRCEEMSKEIIKKITAYHLLIMVLGKFFKRVFGGTTEAAESLARKLIYIMDN